MNQQSRIANLINSKIYPLLLFVVSFVFVMLFSRSTSILYVYEGGDPSVFKQMGLALLRGKTLYVDYFDNKGFLLYLIHAIGLGIGGDFVLMLMQAFSLTVTLSIWDKMLALFHETKGRIVGLSIALFLLLCFYATGDQAQEWCLPFVSYPLLIYFRAWREKHEIQSRQYFLIGLCFGIITFIQVNNVCAFLGFVVYLWLKQLQNKDFKRCFSSMLWLVLGFLLIACPIVMYFYMKEGWPAVNEMLYAVFFSNFEYMGTKIHRSIGYCLPYILFLMAFLTVFILNSLKNKDILIPFLISIVLFIVTNGTLCNIYYLIAVLPLCIVLLMTFDPTRHKKFKIAICSLTLCGLSVYAGIHAFQLINDAILGHEKERKAYEAFHHCIEQIPVNERDSIYNYNLYSFGTGMMQHEGYIQCNRVLFTSLTFMLPTLWKEETSKPFIPPKWMLFSYDKNYDKNDVYFISKNYDVSCSFHYDRMYWRKHNIGDEFDVYLYRRKD